MQIVSPRVLEQVLNSGPAPRLVDVRDPWEFDLCRIAGSENIPMAELMGRLDALGKEDPIVVICHHGARSQQVAAYLDSLGYSNIMNLEGGVDAWSRVVDPEMPKY
ncbi:MAG: sulfurtransferase [Gammaproteobacteria bacterium RIFCSPLOWO2_02_FULL_61_13]|nr:MAG: sulfurtransferase [Gammaproteobacteria bacterium RIFCSPLOWO2_02_FULL_61_13]